MKCFAVFIFCFLVFSCSQIPEESPLPSVKETVMEFGLESRSGNDLIHPEQGLWIIRSNGAMPEIRHMMEVEGNFPADFSDSNLEQLPAVDCNHPDRWTKSGIFAEKINVLDRDKIWTYSSLDSAGQSRMAALAAVTEWTLIDTRHHARGYFARIDGKWYLVALDIRVPCEA